MQIISGQSLIFEIWDNVGSHLSTGEYVGKKKSCFVAQSLGNGPLHEIKKHFHTLLFFLISSGQCCIMSSLKYQDHLIVSKN